MAENLFAGFAERPHTADWALDVWAPDFVSLLREAAKGMYSLSEIELHPGARVERSFSLHAVDLESLLVSFLSELLYLGERDRLAFDTFDLRVENNHLEAILQGAPIVEQSKEIKAVTFHDLKIIDKSGQLSVTIVFDV